MIHRIVNKLKIDAAIKVQMLNLKSQRLSFSEKLT